MLVTLVRTTQRVDTRRVIRQDIEQSLEVLKRDVRNADPSLSFTACNPSVDYVLKSTSSQSSSTNSALDIVLASNQAVVTYRVVKDPESKVYTLQRTYKAGTSSTVTTYLTSTEVDIQSLEISCSELIKENKFLLITIISDSRESDTKGKIVNDTKKITGVTIRNVNTN